MQQKKNSSLRTLRTHDSLKRGLEPNRTEAQSSHLLVQYFKKILVLNRIYSGLLSFFLWEVGGILLFLTLIKPIVW